MRIAHVEPAARDGDTLGPVVMTYQQCSDCSAQWIYGDGSLWLYGHGELLRVADTTGKVVQRWAIPPNPRELLAVDADGLWFAPSVEGGWPIHAPASQLIRYRSLYRVTPGTKRPARAFEIPGASALWLIAAGHTVRLESGGPRSRSPLKLWRLQGPGAKPTYRKSYPANTDQGGDFGEAQPTHAGNAAIGIYYVNNPGPGSPTVNGQQIISLSANAATRRTVATIRPQTAIETYGEGPPAVAIGHSFYFLDPALLDYRSGHRPPLVQSQGILYRVTPRPATRAKWSAARAPITAHATIWDAAGRSLLGTECGHEIRADRVTPLSRTVHGAGVAGKGAIQPPICADDVATHGAMREQARARAHARNRVRSGLVAETAGCQPAAPSAPLNRPVEDPV